MEQITTEEDKDCLNHDIVTYNEGCEPYAETIKHRYEEGEFKVAKPYIWHGHMDVPIIYRMDEDHEWVVWSKPHPGWTQYMTNKATVLQIITDLDYIPPFINEDTDYVIPRINTALLARSRTAKLRCKRGPKPAKVERREEEE